MTRRQIAKNKWKHYRADPCLFWAEVTGFQPDEWQRKAADAVCRELRVTIRSGQGVGKTAFEANVVLWFLMCFSYPRVVCTAPTRQQLNDVLWSEVSKWQERSPLLRSCLHWTKTYVYMIGHEKRWFAVARTSTKPENMQGFHEKNMLFVVDEASGVADPIMEAILGTLSGENNKLLLCGNPTKRTGVFHDSHGLDSGYWRLKVSSRDSPRTNKATIAYLEQKYGKDSDVVRVRVDGEFPKALPDGFISAEWAEAASKAEPTAPEWVGRIDIGIDVARYGDDSSVISAVYNKAVQAEPEMHHHNDTMKLTGCAVQMIKRMALEYLAAEEIHVKIDCDGLGVGVYDRLSEQAEEIADDINERRRAIAEERGTLAVELQLVVEECHFGGEGGSISDDDPVEYQNSTGLMWGTVREALRTGKLALWPSEQQVEQLSNRKYTINSAGKIELERKEAMKKRGLSSPDMADALALAMYDPNTPTWELI